MEKDHHFYEAVKAADRRIAALRSPRPISKELAAYSLGYYSTTLWLWFERHRRDLDDSSALENVQVALDRVRLAHGELTALFRPYISQVLLRILDGLAGMHRGKCRQGEAMPTDSVASGEAAWVGLLELISKAFDEISELRPWFQLGLALGKYQGALDRADSTVSSGPIDLDAWSDIRPVVRAAQAIREADRARIPLLRSMVQLAPDLEEGQATFLREYITTNAAYWPYWPDPIESVPLEFVIIALDHEIQSLTPPKPFWDPEALELRLGDVVVRKVRFDAPHLIAILDAFEEEHWIDSIDDPIPGPVKNRARRLEDAIDQLNNNLLLMRFHGDGSGKGIRWSLQNS